MEIQYKTTAISTGGRSGHVAVQNSSLAFDMAPPAEMGGGSKAGTNPEQLFAAGYAACFGSALQHVVRTQKLPIPAPEVELTVGIGKNDAGLYELAVEIVATFTGIALELADAITAEAHTVCPYSNATRGNIDVTLTAKVK